MKPATIRPLPSAALTEHVRLPEMFVPAPEVWEWALSSFVDSFGALFNPEHAHLEAAKVGFLWTNVLNVRQMRQIVGMAELPQPKGSKWQVARAEMQLRDWFGLEPDFVITLDSVHASRIDDVSFCALIEHEMYHCAHALTSHGAPRFHRDGSPIFGLRGHDVEEFTGIVRRYGPHAATGGVSEMVAAAQRMPEVGAARIAGACGNCLAVAR